MRTLVIGAGPIGAYFAAKLTQSGEDVTLYSLGPAFRRLAEDGIRLAVQGSDEAATVVVRCSLTPPSPENWDLIIFAVKAQDLPIATREFSAHTRDSVALLPQNGLPYWQFLGGIEPETRLRSVDPDCIAESSLSLERTVGCVITKGLSFRSDGVLVEAVVPSDKFVVGDVVVGSNVAPLALGLLQRGGFPAWLTSDIRLEKWRKLLINIAFNPLGALSHLGFGEVLDIDAGNELARSLAMEAVHVAQAFGLSEAINLEAAFERARSSRHHKTSMLQDVEAGRQLELEPILGVMLEMAALRGIDVPTINTIYSCLKLLGLALRKGPIRQLVC